MVGVSAFWRVYSVKIRILDKKLSRLEFLVRVTNVMECGKFKNAYAGGLRYLRSCYAQF